MSPPAIALRPAVDARPPAEAWFEPTMLRPAAPAGQPALRLLEDAAVEPLTGPPTPARVPLTVDVVPAGLKAERAAELERQARTWVPWFAQLLTEAVDGRRPLEPLGRWLDEWVLAEVSRRVRVRRRSRARTGSGPPVQPAIVVSLRTQLTHPRTLEVAAHLRRGGRSSACAFQLLHRGERWRCTALELGE